MTLLNSFKIQHMILYINVICYAKFDRNYVTDKHQDIQRVHRIFLLRDFQF
jgi:hypothetical protein